MRPRHRAHGPRIAIAGQAARFTFCGILVANANPILGYCMAFVSATLLLLGDECKLWDSWQLQLAILEPS